MNENPIFLKQELIEIISALNEQDTRFRTIYLFTKRILKLI